MADAQFSVPDFDRIRRGSDRATEDAVRLLWLMLNDVQTRLKREETAGGGGGAVTAHNILSASHPDTLVASPTSGAMIIGAGALEQTDNTKFWTDGLALAPLITSLGTGGAGYWGDGEVFGGISAFSGTFWQRLAPSATPGAVLTSGATGVSWEQVPPAPTLNPTTGTAPLDVKTLGASVHLNKDSVQIDIIHQHFIKWDVEEFDHGGLWTPAAPTRLTAPAKGVYWFTAQAVWDYPVTGRDSVFLLEVYKNIASHVPAPGTGRVAHSVLNTGVTGGDGFTPGIQQEHRVSRLIELVAGDYLEVMVMPRAGSYSKLKGIADDSGLVMPGYTYFQMLKVG